MITKDESKLTDELLMHLFLGKNTPISKALAHSSSSVPLICCGAFIPAGCCWSFPHVDCGAWAEPGAGADASCCCGRSEADGCCSAGNCCSAAGDVLVPFCCCWNLKWVTGKQTHHWLTRSTIMMRTDQEFQFSQFLAFKSKEINGEIGGRKNQSVSERNQLGN